MSPTMSKEYGSVEWYVEQFNDILADVDTEGRHQDSADNIIKGFLAALDSWQTYHLKQAAAYETMKSQLKDHPNETPTPRESTTGTQHTQEEW